MALITLLYVTIPPLFARCSAADIPLLFGASKTGRTARYQWFVPPALQFRENSCGSGGAPQATIEPGERLWRPAFSLYSAAFRFPALEPFR
ncbi:MAG: hypothetical protein JO204_11220 [Alphaproteobacteria bacterium]|nr:hypothetical protein [Alphaproteobacteria bacterium]